MSTEETIKRFIVENLLSGSAEASIEPNDPLVNSGIVDSMGILRLISFLEDHFDIEIGDGDVGDDNFGTLRRIAALVDHKKENA